jgi:S-adenosylmethionine decarboxylase
MLARADPILYSVDLVNCERLRGADNATVSAAFAAALRRAGASIVEEVSHAFPEAGLTCVLVLRESHAVLHTWPETGTVNIDIFSCSARLKSRQAIEELAAWLGAHEVKVQETARSDGHGSASTYRRA